MCPKLSFIVVSALCFFWMGPLFIPVPSVAHLRFLPLCRPPHTLVPRFCLLGDIPHALQRSLESTSLPPANQLSRRPSLPLGPPGPHGTLAAPPPHTLPHTLGVLGASEQMGPASPEKELFTVWLPTSLLVHTEPDTSPSLSTTLPTSGIWDISGSPESCTVSRRSLHVSAPSS